MSKPTGKYPFEKGVIKKRWHGRRSVALVFPDSYPLGMSNLGFQRVYEILNKKEHVVAERFFFHKGRLTRSLESNRHLQEFDLILFSISFEMGYLNVPVILKGGGLEPFTRMRSAPPLILAGGIACQINPAPLIPVVDGFLLGDFEAIHQELGEVLMDISQDQSREAMLTTLADRVPGVLLSEPTYVKPVRPALVRSLTGTTAHTVIVSSQASFQDTFLLEVTRGCGRGCRFCAAGYVYRPPRPWPEPSLEDTLSDIKGAKRVGLVGLEYANKDLISRLCNQLLNRGLQLGFSSLRADAITDEFVALLLRSKNYTATIAPEAGSQRLRQIINKNLSEEQILAAAESFARVGIKNLKLYFMMGLPLEEDQDIYQMLKLVKHIRKIVLDHAKGRGVMGKIIVSVSTFVPKPWTAFQWSDFIDKKTINRRRSIIRHGLSKVPNIQLRLDSVEEARLQAMISRSDSVAGEIIAKARLDGMGNRRIIKEFDKLSENYLRMRQKDEGFPWEIVDHRVKRSYLFSQWIKAQRAEQTSFCNTTKCKRCGACR